MEPVEVVLAQHGEGVAGAGLSKGGAHVCVLFEEKFEHNLGRVIGHCVRIDMDMMAADLSKKRLSGFRHRSRSKPYPGF